MKSFVKISVTFVFLTVLFTTMAWGQNADELYVSGPCTVSLVCSADSAGTVVALDREDAPYIDIRRTTEAVYVSVDPSMKALGTIRIKVFMSEALRIVSADGRACVEGRGFHSAGQMSLVAASASSINMSDISAGNVYVSLSGSGAVRLSDDITASTVSLSLTGSGRISLDGLATATLSVTQRGSGKITVGGSARKCSVAGLGSGSTDVSKLVSADMDLKLFGTGRIFYPAGVRVHTDGKTDNIISVKPYQPL